MLRNARPESARNQWPNWSGKRTLTMKEEKRLEVIQRVFRGELTVAKAALVLGVSERQCYRVKARVTRRGARGVVHGNRGRLSKRKVKEKTLKRIVELEERRKRRVRLFGMVEKVWEKNKKEKPEVIEREVQEAVRAVRARAAPRRR